jgi:hypothetical protein
LFLFLCCIKIFIVTHIVLSVCPVSFSCFFFNRLFNVLVYDSTSLVKLWGFIFLNNLLIIPSPTKLRRDIVTLPPVRPSVASLWTL